MIDRWIPPRRAALKNARSTALDHARFSPGGRTLVARAFKPWKRVQSDSRPAGRTRRTRCPAPKRQDFHHTAMCKAGFVSTTIVRPPGEDAVGTPVQGLKALATIACPPGKDRSGTTRGLGSMRTAVPLRRSPEGTAVNSHGRQPVGQPTRTTSPGGAKDDTAADFRPFGACREHPPHPRLTPRAIDLRPFGAGGNATTRAG